MTLRHGLFVSGASAGVTAPQDGRLALAALLSRPGVLTGGVVTGSTSGPNMKYTVAAGVFVTQRGVLATDGLYMVPNDGAVTVDSGSPAPSSGTRWDLVWVRQPNAFGSDGFGDANSDPVFGVTVGTAGSTPTKPYASVPAGALVLAESNVGTSIANASLATITNVALYTAAAGGTVVCRSSSEYPASPSEGVQVWDIALQQTMVFSVAHGWVNEADLMTDTGWVNRSSGALSSGTFQYRKIGSLVELRCAALLASSLAAGGTVTLTGTGGLPAGIATGASIQHRVARFSAHIYPGDVAVNADGSVVLTNPGSPNATAAASGSAIHFRVLWMLG